MKARRQYYISAAHRETIKKSMNRPYNQSLIDACENFIKANDEQQKEILDRLQLELQDLRNKNQMAS